MTQFSWETYSLLRTNDNTLVEEVDSRPGGSSLGCFQIVSNFVDSYCVVFLLEYEIYCSDISPAYLVPLYLPTFVAIPRYPKIIFLRQKKAAWPSYDDGKQSFYSILSSPHWEMGCHQLSITTLHCISSEFTKMYFSDFRNSVSQILNTALWLTCVVSSKFPANSS